MDRTKKMVRCAIYTRKSTEDRLEQEYNSLDAQYDACTAYALSQRHEGWTVTKDRYDDGGFSGGTLERAGLKRLLSDIEAGKVDIILLYKIDRLTRSLSDFAKIVEILDRNSASFVSITQSFNTTTSMGRLTLNMLLSFAQFEREVTGERIRNKIYASKRKGIWMGGPVPLGYDVVERKLVVNETEAEQVRAIMQMYLTACSVPELVEILARNGSYTKIQQRKDGETKGGVHFKRGTLYHLLSNRIYRGMTVHKGEAYEAEHEAIVSEELWNEVQAKLPKQGQGGSSRKVSPRTDVLAALFMMARAGLWFSPTPRKAIAGSIITRTAMKHSAIQRHRGSERGISRKLSLTSFLRRWHPAASYKACCRTTLIIVNNCTTSSNDATNWRPNSAMPSMHENRKSFETCLIA